MKKRNQLAINHRQQAGIALFFALIALLMMSLAAVSMIRSVDSNTQIAGNLSYRQSALLISTVAQEVMADEVGPIAYQQSYGDCKTGYYNTKSSSTTGGSTSKECTNPSPSGTALTSTPIGYYATCKNFDGTGNTCSGSKITDDANWQPGATSRYAVGGPAKLTASGFDQITGNTVQYIVERMCKNVGPADNINCLLDGLPANNGSYGGINKTLTGWPLQPNQSPAYRVTVRIDGPKNTVSFVQLFMS